MRAAKPTKLLSLTLTPLLALVVLSGLAFSASPAFAEFGVQRAAVSARTQEGTPAVQAGSHPYSLTTTVIFNEPSRPETVEGNAKDVIVELPPGLIGNPTATPRCSYATFVAKNAGSKCSNDTVIGIAMTYVTTQLHEEYGATSNPVYNLTPAPGEAAQFGYLATGDIPILLGSTVRTGSDYGVSVDAPNIPETAVLAASKVTIWGVPADPSHNPWRGSCLSPVLGGAEPNIEYPGQGLDGGEAEQEGPLYKQGESSPLEGAPTSTGVCPSSAPVAPLLTMPTSCGRPLSAAVSADSWEEQGKFHKAKLELPEMMGCESLALDPKLTVTPDKPDASLSSGLAVNVKVPQEGTLSADGLSEADVRDTTVVLPPGVALNPSSANGLEACSEALVGFEASRGPNANGFEEPPLEPGVSVPIFSPTLPGGSIALFSGETALFEAGVNFCPNASKIGTVRIKLAVLEHPLKGAIYLAAQEANPFGSVMAIYLVAEDPVSGVLVKLPGEVTLCKSVGEDPVNATGEPIPGVTCQAVGQVVTTLLNTPQAPVRRIRSALLRWRKSTAGDARPLWDVYDELVARIVGRGNKAPLRVDGNHKRPERRGMSRLLVAVQPGVDGWRAERRRGRVQPVHADDEPLRRGTEHAVRRSAPAAGPLGDPLEHRTVPRTAGQPRRVRPEQPDRRNDHLRGRRWRPVHGHGRQVLPHRPLQRHGCLYGRTGQLCAVRDHVRGSREGRPVRSRAHEELQPPVRLHRRARQDRSEPDHGRADGHEQPAGDT